MVIADRFPRFQSLPVIERIWSEQTEASDIAEGDAGLAFMPDDVWSQGKCGLKILQYFAAAKPVVANPVGIHREMVIPGANGWLAELRDDWTGVINRLRSDKSERIAMGLAGRELATRAFSVQTWANRWVEAVTGRARRTSQTESRPSRSRDQPARVAVGNPAPSTPLRHGGVA
jgi:hypothetical protein